MTLPQIPLDTWSYYENYALSKNEEDLTHEVGLILQSINIPADRIYVFRCIWCELLEEARLVSNFSTGMPSLKDRQRLLKRMIDYYDEIKLLFLRPRGDGSCEDKHRLYRSIAWRLSLSLRQQPMFAKKNAQFYAGKMDVYWLEADMTAYCDAMITSLKEVLSEISLAKRGRKESISSHKMCCDIAYELEKVCGYEPTAKRSEAFYSLCKLGLSMINRQVSDPIHYVNRLCKTRSYRQDFYDHHERDENGQFHPI